MYKIIHPKLRGCRRDFDENSNCDIKLYVWVNNFAEN